MVLGSHGTKAAVQDIQITAGWGDRGKGTFHDALPLVLKDRSQSEELVRLEMEEPTQDHHGLYQGKR